MNKAIVIALILSCAFARLSLMDEQSKEKAFLNFMKTYGRKYGSSEERLVRFSNFKANLQQIDILNKENPLAQFGITQFSDLSAEEFKETFTGYNPSVREASAKMTIDDSALTAPESVDWVAQGAVTGVKDQKQCGSCWAFSTTGAMEGQNFLKNKSLISFSEQQLVDCDTKADQGCNGGLMDNAFKYLLTHKLETESNYPYTAKGGKCTYDATKGVVGTTGTGFVDVNKNEGIIASTLAQVGPLAIAINATPLQQYQGGILTPTESSCPASGLDHGVLLVGYGVSAGQNFWTVKNSWGTKWGEQGYFRIARGIGACGLNTAVSYPVV